MPPAEFWSDGSRLRNCAATCAARFGEGAGLGLPAEGDRAAVLVEHQICKPQGGQRQYGNDHKHEH